MIDKLETERLILRPFNPDDFEAVHSWASNLANVRYMARGPNSEEDTRAFLARTKSGYDFAIVLKESGKVIGSCGIYPDKNNDTAELGWILHMDHWKNGYGTELAGELIRYGFEDLKLRRIYAPCAAVNYSSYRIMERNKMRREALHIKAFWARVDKEWIDEAVYAILAEEYFLSLKTAVLKEDGLALASPAK
ncbi:MAG: GNAT family N-acetyltransferase [Oscillospiraceae bacterium]|nr:GNAT family N-acetyltransferase [Oscillospiraceae bacterium]